MSARKDERGLAILAFARAVACRPLRHEIATVLRLPDGVAPGTLDVAAAIDDLRLAIARLKGADSASAEQHLRSALARICAFHSPDSARPVDATR